jgi:FkbM family methyltransferase
MAFVLHALRSEDHFVDVGANLGFYTILASGGVGTSCLSLEPIPDTFNQLRRNVQVNGLQERVQALNLGAGRHSDRLCFTSGEGANNRVVDESHE